jgi:hypothetical protein
VRQPGRARSRAQLGLHHAEPDARNPAADRMSTATGPQAGTTSAVWDGALGSGEDIAKWAGPGRINLTWAGVGGWELRYGPRPGDPRMLLGVGERLAVVHGDGLMPVTACHGDLHVTPHRQCILR